MTDAQCRSILVFFRIALLNPKASEEASTEAFRILNSEKRKRLEKRALEKNHLKDVEIASQPKESLAAGEDEEFFEDFEKFFVETTSRIIQKLRKIAEKSKKMPDHRVEVPGVDLSPWRDFLRNSQQEEILAVIWVHILGLKVSAVARGLEVTEGTVRHRLSQGLRRLARKLDPQEPLSAMNPQRGVSRSAWR